MVIAISLLAAATIDPSSAVEPPWGDDMLLERSELVVEGIVLAVKLETIEGKDPAAFRVYRAWLEVERLIKGDKPRSGTIEIVFRRLMARPDSPIGFADAVYEPGERVRAFLKWVSEDLVWTTVQWSGKRTLDPGQAELPLPETVGSTALAIDSDAHRPGCEARDGVWRPLFRGDRASVCVLPTADAGQACTDSSQCEGICHLDGIETGPATGRCSARAPIGDGCWNRVEGGMAHGMICED